MRIQPFDKCRWHRSRWSGSRNDVGVDEIHGKIRFSISAPATCCGQADRPPSPASPERLWRPVRLVLIDGAGVTGLHRQLRHGVLAAAGQPGHGTDRMPLVKEVEDL